MRATEELAIAAAVDHKTPTLQRCRLPKSGQAAAEVAILMGCYLSACARHERK